VGSRFPVGRRLLLVATGGLDYYPAAKLTGHDTTYQSNSDNVNQREDDSYSGADEAISPSRRSKPASCWGSISVPETRFKALDSRTPDADINDVK
jgi:hypothetical protein